jgi:hypothetical protein
VPARHVCRPEVGAGLRWAPASDVGFVHATGAETGLWGPMHQRLWCDSKGLNRFEFLHCGASEAADRIGFGRASLTEDPALVPAHR